MPIHCGTTLNGIDPLTVAKEKVSKMKYPFLIARTSAVPMGILGVATGSGA